MEMMKLHQSEPPRLIEIPRVRDPRGNLSFLQSPGACPFDIRRVFYLYDIPGDAERGGHAHYREQQLLIAVSGCFDVRIYDGRSWTAHRLDRPWRGLLVPPGFWRELTNFSSGSVCLTLSSTTFDEADYIRDFNDYERLVALIQNP